MVILGGSNEASDQNYSYIMNFHCSFQTAVSLFFAQTLNEVAFFDKKKFRFKKKL